MNFCLQNIVVKFHHKAMKKFVAALFLIKFVLLFSFTFSACRVAELSKNESAPAISPQTEDNINRPTSEPYTGDLSIFEDENRAKNLQIERVMDILEIAEGKTIADIGAGSGWFTIRAANRVGEKGKVFAVEINQEFIDHIDERAKKENFTNIQTVLGTEDNPKLPENSVDAVLILKTYHEISEPVKVLKNLRVALRENALVGIIDKTGSGDDHGVDKKTVIDEAKIAGFSLKEEFDFVKPDGMDYFLVFQVEKRK